MSIALTDDIITRAESLLDGHVTHRERLIIQAFAEQPFRRDQLIYELQQRASRRPEAGR